MESQLWMAAGWTMLHYLWIGTLLGVGAAIGRLALKGASPVLRYGFAVGCFLALAVTPVFVFVWMVQNPGPQWMPADPASLAHNDLTPSSQTYSLSSAPLKPPVENPVLIASEGPLSEGSSPFVPTVLTSLGATLAPYLPWLWLLGTPVTFGIMILGLAGVERLRRQTVSVTEGWLADLTQRLASSLHITRTFSICVCDRVVSPVVVGVLKPMIILPTAALSGWTPEQMELVLLHELTHIRRWDTLTNLVQRVVESLLFFHPVVWCVSRWVRTEREHCCDEIVLSHRREPIVYAQTLAALAGWKFGEGKEAVAMAEHSVVARIRQILKVDDRSVKPSRKVYATLVGTFFLATCVLFQLANNVNSAGPLQTAEEKQEPPAGLIDHLPEDGSWAQFHAESSFGGIQTMTVTLASVGRKAVDGETCRWMEIVFDEPRGPLIYKLLIPEKHLKRGEKPLDHVVEGWRSVHGRRPEDITDMDRFVAFGPLSFFLTGPQKEIGELEEVSVKTSLGTLDCRGWSGKGEMPLPDGEMEFSLSQRLHERSPFGVVQAQLDCEIRREGKSFAAGKLTVTLKEAGEGAQSRLAKLTNTSQPSKPRKPFSLEPGWKWVIKPINLRGGTMLATEGLVLGMDWSERGFSLNLAYPSSSVRYRPVAFDVDQRRYELNSRSGGASGEVGLASYVLSPEILPPEKVRFVGIEKLTVEGAKAYSEAKTAEAKEVGIETMPFPQLNKPYEFVVTTVEGKKISSRDYQGKVLLIDYWATWCSPCIKKMPELKKLFEKWHPRGFEALGVCLDHDTKTMKKSIEANGLVWTQVMPSTKPRTRELWQESSGIRALPRLLLLDRQGILRADSIQLDFEEEIEKLLAE